MPVSPQNIRGQTETTGNVVVEKFLFQKLCQTRWLWNQAWIKKVEKRLKDASKFVPNYGDDLKEKSNICKLEGSIFECSTHTGSERSYSPIVELYD